MKPYIILNTAMSLDGRIARKEERVVFSNELDKARRDDIRKSVDGVMVGINTVLIDNPKLTVSEKREENPARIIVDGHGKVPDDANVLNDKAKNIVVVSMDAEPYRIEELSRKASVIVCGDDEVDVVKLMDELYKRGIKRVLLEGGGHLNKSMLEANLIDEIYVSVAPVVIGDGVNLVEGIMDERKLALAGIRQIGDMVVLKYFPKK
ncbi:2,5-diamino-6-ribosylamino-4(3H)-pyrimidinone 5'-phosphate reductase [groundwater metagenome]|uniref:2,5-diamino-6-ribosylamino-4(3H)-pyrimidinone 5'-phosphate reductase n=1 Tax=groundwater metagenome TaxID=717931 RepID=A0A098EB35_9ZZZZ